MLFTTHYLMLRGFYALERTRTVFWVQCVIAATNIALAVALTPPPRRRGPRPAWCSPTPAPTSSARSGPTRCCAGCLGGLETPALVRFLVRLLLAAGIATLCAWAVRHGLDAVWAPVPGRPRARCRPCWCWS